MIRDLIGKDARKAFKGETALIKAALHERTRAAKVLIEAGADLNAKNKAGKIALDLASNEESKALIRNCCRKETDLVLRGLPPHSLFIALRRRCFRARSEGGP